MGPRVDLLDGDVERSLRAGDEVDDDLFEVVRSPELGGSDERLDLAVGEARHEGRLYPG